MSTPAELESRAKNAGFDVEFHKQIMKLEELKELVKRGDLKEEVYKQLEDQVFKMKEKPAESSIATKRKNKSKGKTFARRFLPSKTKEKLKTLDRKASRSRGGSVKSTTQRSRADSAKSFLSSVSERAKSAFRGRDTHNVLLEAEMMKFVKTRTKKKWAKVYTILYTDRVVFKSKKRGKVIKTVKLNEDCFVSTVDEKGAKKIVQRAVDDEDSLKSEDEAQVLHINENLQKMDEIMVMNNVFVIASLDLKRKQKVILACENDEQREVWVAMTCEVIRKFRELALNEQNKMMDPTSKVLKDISIEEYFCLLVKFIRENGALSYESYNVKFLTLRTHFDQGELLSRNLMILKLRKKIDYIGDELSNASHNSVEVSLLEDLCFDIKEKLSEAEVKLKLDLLVTYIKSKNIEDKIEYFLSLPEKDCFEYLGDPLEVYYQILEYGLKQETLARVYRKNGNTILYTRERRIPAGIDVEDAVTVL